MNKTNNKKKLATVVMAGLGITCILGGAFALMYDSLTHSETVTVEWVEIIDGSDSDVHIEEVGVPGVAVTEMTPGKTYTLVGSIENNTTVDSNWVATATGATGINITIADSDGDGMTDAEELVGIDALPGTGDETDPLVPATPVAPYAPVDVASFGITITTEQDVAQPSVDTPITFTFSATDGR